MLKPVIFAIASIVCSGSTALAAAPLPAYLVKDSNTQATGVGARNLGAGAGALFFSGSDGIHGLELWRSDGTEAGTVLVKDIVPGGSDSGPGLFVAGDALTFFVASDSAHGTELWRTDGSEAGTALVKDIRPGAASAINPPPPGTLNIGPEMGYFDGMLLFSADDGTVGAELWRSDGTEAGTRLVKNVDGSPQASDPSWFTKAGDVIFFSVHGGLWRTDGTEAGTTLVKAFTPSLAVDRPVGLTALNDAVLFGVVVDAATINDTAIQLWRSDGTEPGTQMLATFQLLSSALGTVGGQAVAGGRMLFGAAAPGMMSALWRTDGTADGTEMLRSFTTPPSVLTAVGDEVYFAGNDMPTGIELWKSDGTVEGTMPVKDIISGTGSSNPSRLTELAGNVYFAASNGTAGRLWRSDGTPGGTVPIGPAPNGLTATQDLLFFVALDPQHGQELWRSDGTPAGTHLVKDVFPGTADSGPAQLTALGSTLLFTATDGITGVELWRTDLTASGTQLVRDIAPGAAPSFINFLTPMDGHAVFSANEPTTGSEPWITDGTTAGTVMLADLVPGTGSSSPRNFVPAGDRLFFTASVPGAGEEPFVSDGTAAGTQQVKDVNAGSTSSVVSNLDYQSRFVAVGNELYFTADDGMHGIQLWKSDGSEGGTKLVKQIAHRFPGYGPQELTALADRVLFTADTQLQPIIGPELWSSDGTDAGTAFVTGAGAGPIDPIHLTNIHGVVYFAGIDHQDATTHGFELWRTDGTAAGTFQVKDINPGAGNAFDTTPSFDPQFRDVGGIVYFVANDGMHGYEVWRTDGTEDGTRLLRDIMPGANGAFVNSLTAVNGVLAFVANDGVHGYELWLSDGTEAGTRRAVDLYPDLSILTYSLVAFGSDLVIPGYDAVVGRELFALPVGSQPTPTKTPSGAATATRTATTGASVTPAGEGTATATPAASSTPTPIPTASASPGCVGDCNGDHEVGINELILGVNISLNLLTVDRCPAFDPDGNQQVAINELIRAVNNSLNGCSAPT